MASGRILRRGAERLGAVLAIAILTALLAAAQVAAAPPAGPPYPDAVAGQRVYDYAGIFSPAAITEAESIIARIEARSGAQVAVYSQIKPASNTLDKANADARSLMDQWGVGRKGIDDGLVILFDMETNLKHGQVSLYAGGGFLAGLRDVDANATPEHRATLEQGRFVNSMIAVVGLVVGLVLLLWAIVHWFRHGRDPIVIDDNSILMPAPPPDLTPAMATILLENRNSDRTVTAGLVDLAAQGCIAFTSHGKTVSETKTGLKYLTHGDAILPGPEAALRDAIAAKGLRHEGVIVPSSMYRLIHSFDSFKSGLEAEAIAQG